MASSLTLPAAVESLPLRCNWPPSITLPLHPVEGKEGKISNDQRQEVGDLMNYAKVYPTTEGKEKSVKSMDMATSRVELLTSMTPPKISIDDLPKRRIVKVVVTKKQLEELLKNMKDLEGTGTTVHFAESFWEKERSPRCVWRPSLTTIPE